MNEFEKIDVKQILKMLLRNVKIIIASVLIFAIAFFAYNEFVVVPKYRSSVSLCLNNSEGNMNIEDKVLMNDITASQMLIPHCIELVKSRRMCNAVEKYLNEEYKMYNYGARQIGGMISISSVEGTAIFKISVTSTSAADAAMIAEAFSKVVQKQLPILRSGISVEVIDFAEKNVNPINKNKVKSVATGMAVGFALACAFILIRELLDVRIKNEADLEKLFDYPILGVIPKIGDKNSGQEGYYYRNSYYKSGKGGAYYGGAKKTKV